MLLLWSKAANDSSRGYKKEKKTKKRRFKYLRGTFVSGMEQEEITNWLKAKKYMG